MDLKSATASDHPDYSILPVHQVHLAHPDRPDCQVLHLASVIALAPRDPPAHLDHHLAACSAPQAQVPPEDPHPALPVPPDHPSAACSVHPEDHPAHQEDRHPAHQEDRHPAHQEDHPVHIAHPAHQVHQDPQVPQAYQVLLQVSVTVLVKGYNPSQR